MISRPLTRVVLSTEMTVAPGATILAEGQALVRSNGATYLGVLPSTGTSTDVFQGFSFAGTSAYPFPEQYTNNVESFTVPATGSVVLSLTPLAGQVAVYDLTLGEPVTGFSVTGNTVSGLTVGDTVNVTYKYAMTIVQATALYGNVQPGGYSGAYVGQIGVITRGFIMTDQFDASQNWMAAGATSSTQIVLGASGQLTLGTPGTTGVAFPGSVVRIPDEYYPFLGVEFSAQV
jgi:hypothetical protein